MPHNCATKHCVADAIESAVGTAMTLGSQRATVCGSLDFIGAFWCFNLDLFGPDWRFRVCRRPNFKSNLLPYLACAKTEKLVFASAWLTSGRVLSAVVSTRPPNAVGPWAMILSDPLQSIKCKGRGTLQTQGQAPSFLLLAPLRLTQEPRILPQ